jgi:hypothetical protein
MAESTFKEVVWLRRELVRTLKETNPKKDLVPDLILAMLDLHRIERALRKTVDINERRNLNHEFYIRRDQIKGAIRGLRKAAYPGMHLQQGLDRRALP